MHHFVVRKRQYEIFSIRIELAEGELIMVIAPVDGVMLEIAQRVVHPAHIPLHGEAQAAEISRA